LSLFCCFSCRGCFCLSGRLRKELFEILEKIRGGIEEMCNLRVDVLDWLRLALVGLKDFKELFVDFWSFLKSVLVRELAQKLRLRFVYSKISQKSRKP
jgi:hypothetical protein